MNIIQGYTMDINPQLEQTTTGQATEGVASHSDTSGTPCPVGLSFPPEIKSVIPDWVYTHPKFLALKAEMKRNHEEWHRENPFSGPMDSDEQITEMAVPWFLRQLGDEYEAYGVKLQRLASDIEDGEVTL